MNPQDEIKQLKAQIADLTRRLDALYSPNFPEEVIRNLVRKGFIRWEQTLLSPGTNVQFEDLFVEYGTVRSVVFGQSRAYFPEFKASTSDTCTTSTSNMSDGDAVFVLSTGTPPGGLSLGTQYYLRDVSGNTFKLASSPGGSAIDITSTGAGVHYLNFV